MSKRILTGIACIGIVWVVGANAERLLGDDPHENAMWEGGFAGNQITEEEEVESDNPFEDMPDESSRGRGARMRRPGMGGGMGMAMGRSGMAGRVNVAASETAGSFSVVSDGKRSIMVNTSTGDSWLLVIDNPGTQWEPIKKLAAAQQDNASQTTSSIFPQYQPPVDSVPASDQPVLGRQLNDDKMEEVFKTVLRKKVELSAVVDKMTVRHAEMENEIAHLKKQLEEAEELLKARDKEAQADVIDASQVQ